MVESTATRLAVARLEGPEAAQFSPAADRPLQGYCMVNGEALTVYLEDGQGQTALLEGRLVWLEGGSVVTLPSGAVWPPEPPALDGGAEAELPETEAEPEAQAGLAMLLEHHAAEEFPLNTEPDEEAVFEAPAEVPTEAPAEVPTQALAEAPATEPLVEPEPQPTEEPSQVGFKLYPEPATPVSTAFSSMNVALASRHPLAPRAVGTAQLDLRTGRLAVHVRGMPTPAALGRDQTTGRPLNAYRAWLTNQHTGQRVDLGLLTRVWGENFRLEADGSLPLHRYDALLVTAEDRTGDSPDPAAPQVLFGQYRGA